MITATTFLSRLGHPNQKLARGTSAPADEQCMHSNIRAKTKSGL